MANSLSLRKICLKHFNLLVGIWQTYSFLKYISSCATSNKGRLHTLSWVVSLKQPVTCVTISNKEDVIGKFEQKNVKILAAAGYFTLFWDFNLAHMIKTSDLQAVIKF